MMKKIIITAALSFVTFTSLNAQIKVQVPAQTNILDENPFLDASTYVKFPNSTGKGLYFPTTDLTQWTFKTDRISRSNFSTAFNGLVVYNSGTGKTGSDLDTQGIQVDVEPGFYYFYNPEGSARTKVAKGKWVRIGGSGELSTGLDNGKFWTLNGNSNTTEAVLEDDTNRITAGNFIGTTDAKSLTFATNSVARLVIGKDGGLITERVGSRDFDFVLKVLGKAKFDKGLVTSASTYPDYVFDNYFTGKSDENPNYQFKKLHEVEQFIKENNHLPGVTSIKELTKSEAGYDVDNTKLSIQTLEKVEELYLHVIEQQKEIQALKAEVAELKK